MGQCGGCPLMLRLARTHAGQSYHSGHVACGYRAKAPVRAGQDHPLSPRQRAWMATAPRGPPGWPASRRRPRHRRMSHTTLSPSGDRDGPVVTCTAPARESLPTDCTLPDRVPPLKVLPRAGAQSEQNSIDWRQHNSAASDSAIPPDEANVGHTGGRRRARHRSCHPRGELRGQCQRV